MGRPVTTPGVTAPCGTAEYSRQVYAAKREKLAAASLNRYHQKKLRLYGLTQEEYDHLEALGCAACGALDSGKYRLSIDHDHETGMFRGLLCSNCNTALGLLGESLERVLALGVYLEKVSPK